MCEITFVAFFSLLGRDFDCFRIRQAVTGWNQKGGGWIAAKSRHLLSSRQNPTNNLISIFGSKHKIHQLAKYFCAHYLSMCLSVILYMKRILKTANIWPSEFILALYAKMMRATQNLYNQILKIFSQPYINKSCDERKIKSEIVPGKSLKPERIIPSHQDNHLRTLQYGSQKRYFLFSNNFFKSFPMVFYIKSN